MKLNKRYKIIYDDKGNRPVTKIGEIVSKENTLFTLKSEKRGQTLEILNTNYVIRVEEM